MHIVKAHIQNFRLLKNTTLEFKRSISWLIGRNNTGKTSLIKLFEIFFDKKKRFDYYDFPISLRENIHSISAETDINDLAIRLVLEIEYSDKDNLDNLSDFIVDLDPTVNTVNIMFEAIIDRDKLIHHLSGIQNEDQKKKTISKVLKNYLKLRIFAFEKINDKTPLSDYIKTNKIHFVEKDLSSVQKAINLQIIHAKRDVVSSESEKTKHPLSNITTKYFSHKNKDSSPFFEELSKVASKIDIDLNKKYKVEFETFLSSSKDFLNLGDLNVVSDIEAGILTKDTSKVIYGEKGDHLPENFNGLGFVNILYLLLDIQIKKDLSIETKSDINLFFIEEPEAHTHPQLQYVFANKISEILMDIGTDPAERKTLQSVITSHSPHMISQSNFENLKYLKKDENNIIIKNFNEDLEEAYGSEKESFKFVRQYLNIQSCELFFAKKVIFIEGVTEKMLLPYFIDRIDLENPGWNGKSLKSQNISIIEIGANAKSFRHFIDFLEIKTLIITDIDTTALKINPKTNKKTYSKICVKDATHLSNESIKYFFNTPDFSSQEFQNWFDDIKNSKKETISQNIKVSYQLLENKYHARSFEDSFVNINKDLIRNRRENLLGLKNKFLIDNIETKDVYELTEKILDKKTDFASSILYQALTNDIEWNIPQYIKDGLRWLQQD